MSFSLLMQQRIPWQRKLNNRNLFCHSSKDQKSKTMVWAELTLWEAIVKKRLQVSLQFHMVANNFWHFLGVEASHNFCLHLQLVIFVSAS